MKTPQPRLAGAMTPFPYSIDLDATLTDARRMIAAHDFHHLPVTAGGRVVGMLLSQDLSRAEYGHVREYYRPDALIVDIETPLAGVLATMANEHIDAAIVVRHGKLAGVFTTTDACRAFSALLSALWPEPGDDLVA